MPLPGQRRTQRHHDKVELLEATQTANPDAPLENDTTFASYAPAQYEWWTVQPGNLRAAQLTNRERAAGLLVVHAPRTSTHLQVGKRFLYDGQEYEIIQTETLTRYDPAGIAELVAQ